MKRVMVVLGTRPELIKLAPVVQALRQDPGAFSAFVCCTGQHSDLLDPLWPVFGLSPDADLRVMQPGQQLAETAARILTGLAPLLSEQRPDLVLVQGDTLSTFCGALAAFYQHIPVGHVEAGLRTHNLQAPFPEELNRVMVSRIAALHFAPTEAAAGNLRREGVPEDQIHITGNTGIDALLNTLQAIRAGTLQPAQRFPRSEQPRAVVTMHRRESFGEGLASVCQALNSLSAEGIELIVPLHPNPEARQRILEHLHTGPRVTLCNPLDYVSFLALLSEADIVITDSGGIQEEAPYLGVPAVVVRTVTERPEGVAGRFARVVGYQPETILVACREALQSPPRTKPERDTAPHHSIYGDGASSSRIRELISSFLSK